MKRSERLKIVVRLAEREEEKSAKLFEQARDMYEKEVQRLRDIEQYYRDYEASFAAKTRGLRAAEIANARALLQQIVAVRESQKLQIQRMEKALENAKKVWHKNHLKCENLQSLVNRYRIEEDYELDKREQKMIDEWVSRSQFHRGDLP